MKHFLLSALTLTLLSCAKTAEPAPAAPAPVVPVTFTDAAGTTVAVKSYSAYSVTATPAVSRQPRRAVIVRAQLANGSTLDVTYTYVGNTFIAGAGPMVLDEAPLVDNYGGSLSTPTRYQAAGGAPGTLVSENAQPAAVSGTYTGPLVAGGGAVKLVFSKLTF